MKRLYCDKNKENSPVELEGVQTGTVCKVLHVLDVWLSPGFSGFPNAIKHFKCHKAVN